MITHMTDTLADEWRAANVAPLWQDKLSHTTDWIVERSQHWPWTVLRALADKTLTLQDMDVIEGRVLLLDKSGAEIQRRPLDGDESPRRTPGAGTRRIRSTAPPLDQRHTIRPVGQRCHNDGERSDLPDERRRFGIDARVDVARPRASRRKPIVWLDVLDAHLHRFLGTDAFEPGPAHNVPDASREAYHFPWTGTR